ncbi:hypothetical protein [Anaerosporobacter sp.]|uniref:hypothetical protein n=1 Tax=Anaerosporobacter sp. TaxID=1872529 RepID=UPI00286EFB89|nr:hypothetical protein [Anaerosporobacter sp.]
MKLRKIIKCEVGIIIVGLLVILVMSNLNQKNNSNNENNASKEAHLDKESEEEFIRCSLQDNDVARRKNTLITMLMNGCVFDTTSDKQPYYSCGEYEEYLGLEGAGPLFWVLNYKDKVIYITPYVIQEGKEIRDVAIVQNIENDEYEIINMVEDSQNHSLGIANNVWLIGDKLYYDIYSIPKEGGLLKYSIQTLDLETYKKQTICNYDELGIEVPEGGTEDNYFEDGVTTFVVRKDGAVAFCAGDFEEGMSVFICKDGNMTKRIEKNCVELVDYDMQGLYYVKRDLEEKVYIEEYDTYESIFELVVQTEDGEETILFKERMDEEKKVFYYISYRIFDDYFAVVGKPYIIELYDYKGTFIKEIKLKEEGDQCVRYNKEWNLYYIIWNKDSDDYGIPESIEIKEINLQ